MFSSFVIALVSVDIICVPLSDNNVLGKPYLAKRSINAWQTAAAVMFFNGIASGHLLAISTIVNIYL